jgi:hypothetical protein
MKPIGLTMKRGRNKYQREPRGELMLIHECVECKALSINRIAADDDTERIMAVFQESAMPSQRMHTVCQGYGIMILKPEDGEIVYAQLYGRTVELPAISWR